MNVVKNMIVGSYFNFYTLDLSEYGCESDYYSLFFKNFIHENISLHI